MTATELAKVIQAPPTGVVAQLMKQQPLPMVVRLMQEPSTSRLFDEVQRAVRG